MKVWDNYRHIFLPQVKLSNMMYGMKDLVVRFSFHIMNNTFNLWNNYRCLCVKQSIKYEMKLGESCDFVKLLVESTDLETKYQTENGGMKLNTMNRTIMCLKMLYVNDQQDK